MKQFQKLAQELNKQVLTTLIDKFNDTNNKIIILSKGKFKTVLSNLNINENNVESFSDYIFISILNNDDGNTGYFKSNKSNVLILKFDDIEFDDETPTSAFTEDQAQTIIDFIEKHEETILNGKCIIHCYAGVSRSGAIGSFINSRYNLDTEKFNYFNPQIVPNIHVLKTLNLFV